MKWFGVSWSDCWERFTSKIFLVVIDELLEFLLKAYGDRMTYLGRVLVGLYKKAYICCQSLAQDVEWQVVTKNVTKQPDQALSLSDDQIPSDCTSCPLFVLSLWKHVGANSLRSHSS